MAFVKALKMTTFLVTYDINKEKPKPDRDRAKLLAHIKTFAFAYLSESSYAIDCQLTAPQLYNLLRQHLDPDDTIYVITLTRRWDGFGPTAVNRWLQQRLGLAG